MKVWKLVSGILSIILFVFVSFQSCAAGVSNALEANGEASGSAGIIVAILMLAGGIVSIATRKSLGKGGKIVLHKRPCHDESKYHIYDCCDK